MPLRRPWNDRALRHGDRLPAGDAGDNGKEEFTFVRQNLLTPDGVLRQAWTGLGKCSSQREGVDGVGTVHGHDLKCLVCFSSVTG